MTWGGLRGAVGLALVLSMRELLMQQGKQETARLMAPGTAGATAAGATGGSEEDGTAGAGAEELKRTERSALDLDR